MVSLKAVTKSQEVHELRNKFIHSNELGLELTKLSTEAKPDEAKIKELQQQVMDVQKRLCMMYRNFRQK